ncbi:hypothetical protein ACPA1U_24510, partial [Ectopseudomonas hydrolytica]
MLFVLRMLLMGVHFVIAGLAGLLLGLCRPFNPDNSRLCAPRLSRGRNRWKTAVAGFSCRARPGWLASSCHR